MTSLNHKCELYRQETEDKSLPEKPVFPDIYMPAMPPLGLIAALENWISTWKRRRRLLRLLDYDDHMLEDMGYTRQDLLWAVEQPLRVDARQVLQQQRAHQRWLRGAGVSYPHFPVDEERQRNGLAGGSNDDPMETR